MEITKVNISHLETFKIYFNECVVDGLKLYESTQENYESFLKKWISYSAGENLPDGWPPITMYICIDAGVIIGAIRVRHGMNDYIKNVIGHIGYETSPKARGRGIATTMLNWVKNNIIEDDVIITCDENNIASKKVIEKCGGLYLNVFYSKEENRHVRRYQLQNT